MKKLLLGLVLLISISSWANTSSLKIKGFSDLDYSKLSDAIMQETKDLDNVKIISFKRAILDYISTPYEYVGLFGASKNKDRDYYSLTFEASLNNNIEIIKCNVQIVKKDEDIVLKNCGNDNVVFSDDYINIDFKDVDLKRLENITVIN